MATPNIFIGTVGEGVWRSTDGGETWNRSSKGMFVECDVRALVADPHRHGVLYAGTNEGVWRTDNYAQEWTRLDGPLDNLVTWSLLLLPDDDVLFAGTRPAGIYRRAGTSGSWQKCGANLAQQCPGILFNRVTTLAADPLDRDRLWAGVEIDGPWTSRDRGETWQKVGQGLSSADIHGLAIVPGAAGRRTLLATTNNDLNISHDDGETWEPQKVGKQFGHDYCRGLVQRPDRREVLFLGNGDGPPGSVGAAWRSDDAGQNWRQMALPGKPNSTIWDFTFDPTSADRIYAYSVSGELYHSTDAGQQWSKLPREFGEIRAIACAVAS